MEVFGEKTEENEKDNRENQKNGNWATYVH